MILITGAAGFIGSALIAYFNEKKIFDAIPVDDFSTPMRFRNLAWKLHSPIVDRNELEGFLKTNGSQVQAIVHLGAKAGYHHENWATHEASFFQTNQMLWNWCTEMQIPFLFAGSGAVYESGQWGYKDDIETSQIIQPQHPYTAMRANFDKWALSQIMSPPFWASLRMFNVYGPNEYHKMNNASMIFKGYNEIQSYGNIRLYASNKAGIPDGGMKRDFIYVKDVAKIIHFLLENRPESGIYNMGTGQSRSFVEMSELLFQYMGMRPSIQFEPIQESLQNHFPYFSEADISKLRLAGYADEMYNLEKGIADYLERYLMKGEFY